jgi:hypothetical protein
LCVISARVQINSLIKSGESTFILVVYNPTRDNWRQKLTDFNKGSMESQQIVELLLSMQAKMDANIKAYHEEIMAMVDAYHERMMACLGKTEADTEKTEPNQGMKQSTEEHQEIPKGEAAVMRVKEPRSGVGSGVWPRSAARSRKKGPGEIVGPGGSWLLPAGRCLAVQEWHGTGRASSEKLGPRKIVDRARGSPPPLE